MIFFNLEKAECGLLLLFYELFLCSLLIDKGTMKPLHASYFRFINSFSYIIDGKIEISPNC